GAYNISLPLRLRGGLQVEALERALTEIVNRHDALRTRLAVADGVPVQVVEPQGSFALELADISHIPEPERTRRTGQMVDELTEQPFDLERGPLVRARLVRLDDRDHVLQLVFSHVVFDAASKAVLF